MSGFLVSQSWVHDAHPSRFLARHLLRVVPALAAVTLLTALVLGPLVELTYFGLTPCLVVWLAFLRRDLVGRVHLPGDYSYGIYVFAFPIQQLLAHSFHGTLRMRTLLVLSVAATTIVGPLSWHWIEKPALERRPHKPPRDHGRPITLGCAI